MILKMDVVRRPLQRHLDSWKQFLMQLPREFVWLLAVFAVASIGSTALVAARIAYTFDGRFLSLPYNLFLAWIPMGLALVLHRLDATGQGRSWKFYAGAIIWLFFLPNAPYIVTDLVHLRFRPPMPLCADAIIIVSFAWTGLVLGFFSLYLMQRIVAARMNWMAGWIFVLLVLTLTGLGVYIGRYLRWNSWDVVVSPFALGADLWQQFRHPRSHPAPFLHTLLFSKLFIIAYVTLYAVSGLRRVEQEGQRPGHKPAQGKRGTSAALG